MPKPFPKKKFILHTTTKTIELVNYEYISKKELK